MEFTNILKLLASGETLSAEQMFGSFEMLLSNTSVTDAQIGALLFATSSRAVTSEELVGAARSLRKHVLGIDSPSLFPGVDLVDTCGTGGSGFDTFNTSTLVAFIIAASGQKVAKHGNRGSTSRCGSADLLKALGINIDLTANEISNCLARTGFGFFFAPNHHPATKRVVGIRRELGFRTIFNFLGPLVNPAGVSCQLLGVSSAEMLPRMAEALSVLGIKKALVVRGNDGLDEITICNSSEVYEVCGSNITHYQITPEEFGLDRVSFSEVCGGDCQASAKISLELLKGKVSAYRSLVLLNSAAALYVCGKARSIKDGLPIAAELVDSGKALKILEQVKEISNEVSLAHKKDGVI